MLLKFSSGPSCSNKMNEKVRNAKNTHKEVLKH